ncbi:TIGR02679 family protein [Promicromonospora iranensis]|uniref:TIGR02679 family protein n=1 Tax=Promicromonospora iranensis TaxID=1105144 RepID=UPI0023A9F3E5|nr:TIGR02679 family protein [Promicromonospora iranensis]
MLDREHDPATPADHRLSHEIREYLGHPSLADLWAAIRTHLERNELAGAGTVTVELDHDAADLLNGLVGASRKPWKPGRRQVSLQVLDTALRASAAQAGLVSVVADLTGTALVDRRATREQQERVRSALWADLDKALARAGLADAPWIPGFVEGLRTSGLLTRAGEAAGRIVSDAGAVLTELKKSGVLAERRPETEPTSEPLEPAVVELGELASRTTGDAHGLDEGRPIARLVLRAAASALDVPIPKTSRGTRDLWAMLGVSPDNVSGTALTWGLRPPGDSLWARSMRERADAGLVTHLTLQELDAAGLIPDRSNPERDLQPAVELGTRVWACENPQVIQAVARSRIDAPFVCTAGNPSTAAWQLMSLLINASAEVRYHGDFDWPGIWIANRLYSLGARPWRMGAVDYEHAVDSQQAAERLPLEGAPRPTPWDLALAPTMQRRQSAVHEEALLDLLLRDASISS